MEKVVVLLKPDGVELNIAPAVKELLFAEGLKLVTEKLLLLDRGLVARWRPKKHDAKFSEEYIAFLISGNCHAMLWEGINARRVAKEIKGSGNPPSGIRGRHASSIIKNVMHSSETEEETQFDLQTFFSDKQTAEG